VPNSECVRVLTVSSAPAVPTFPNSVPGQSQPPAGAQIPSSKLGKSKDPMVTVAMWPQGKPSGLYRTPIAREFLRSVQSPRSRLFRTTRLAKAGLQPELKCPVLNWVNLKEKVTLCGSLRHPCPIPDSQEVMADGFRPVELLPTLLVQVRIWGGRVPT